MENTDRYNWENTTNQKFRKSEVDAKRIAVDTEEESIILRGDNFLMVDLDKTTRHFTLRSLRTFNDDNHKHMMSKHILEAGDAGKP